MIRFSSRGAPARRSFNRGTRVHPKNHALGFRAGYRL